MSDAPDSLVPGLPALPSPLLCRGKLGGGVVWCGVERPQRCRYAISFGYGHFICTHPEKITIAKLTLRSGPPGN